MTTANEFLETTLRPTLQKIDMHSEAAENLLLMIACHESRGFDFIKQINGPARSYFQIEPRTLLDLYRTYLYKHGARFRGLIQPYEAPDCSLEDNLLNPDQKFAVVAARLILWRVPPPIPDPSKYENVMAYEVALAHYAKKHWNTAEGKATASKYLNDYLRYKPEGYGEW